MLIATFLACESALTKAHKKLNPDNCPNRIFTAFKDFNFGLHSIFPFVYVLVLALKTA